MKRQPLTPTPARPAAEAAAAADVKKITAKGRQSTQVGFAPIAPILSDDEWTFVAECLRLAQQSILESIKSINNVWPESTLGCTLSKWAEQAADIRERIEKR